jgi:hypothetical protein
LTIGVRIWELKISGAFRAINLGVLIMAIALG